MYQYNTNILVFLMTFIALMIPSQSHSTDACSRTAIIGHQEILVDTSSSQKGEGLRFFLEQDPAAKSYLDEYQDNSHIRWQNAALGTAGTGLIIAGILSNVSSETRQNLYVSGVSLILVNFLVARTLEMTNERNLVRAIDEYNKRNLPRIHFSPEGPTSPSTFYQKEQEGPAITLSKSWSF